MVNYHWPVKLDTPISSVYSHVFFLTCLLTLKVRIDFSKRKGKVLYICLIKTKGGFHFMSLVVHDLREVRVSFKDFIWDTLHKFTVYSLQLTLWREDRLKINQLSTILGRIRGFDFPKRMGWIEFRDQLQLYLFAW